MNKVAILLGSASDKHIVEHSLEYLADMENQFKL